MNAKQKKNNEIKYLIIINNNKFNNKRCISFLYVKMHIFLKYYFII